MPDEILIDIIKEWSVKVGLSESEYKSLKEIANELDISLKKLVNKSIKLALKDIDNKKYYERSDRVLINIEDKIGLYSLKIKSEYYGRIKEICRIRDLNMRDLVRDILSMYPYLLVRYEEDFWNK